MRPILQNPIEGQTDQGSTPCQTNQPKEANQAPIHLPIEGQKGTVAKTDHLDLHPVMVTIHQEDQNQDHLTIIVAQDHLLRQDHGIQVLLDHQAVVAVTSVAHQTHQGLLAAVVEVAHHVVVVVQDAEDN